MYIIWKAGNYAWNKLISLYGVRRQATKWWLFLALQATKLCLIFLNQCKQKGTSDHDISNHHIFWQYKPFMWKQTLNCCAKKYIHCIRYPPFLFYLWQRLFVTSILSHLILIQVEKKICKFNQLEFQVEFASKQSTRLICQNPWEPYVCTDPPPLFYLQALLYSINLNSKTFKSSWCSFCVFIMLLNNG